MLLSALKCLHLWCAISLHPASLKGILQIQAGGDPVCLAGTPWGVATSYYALFAEFSCRSLGDYKTSSFRKTPTNLCFHMITCDQNVTALIICISDERVKLQWAKVFVRSCENGAQDAQAFWWRSGPCACEFVWVAGDRYILIKRDLRAARYRSHTWLHDKGRPEVCGPQVSLQKAVLFVPMEKIDIPAVK